MMEIAGSRDSAELRNALRRALAEGSENVRALEGSFRRCVSNLRLGGSGQNLAELSDAIASLALLTELVGQLRTGLLVTDLEARPFSMWQIPSSAEAFQGLVKALEEKDWVFLADLLEYEICPLMLETDKEMSQLSKRLEPRG
ncbi:MAG: hypothetical protein HXX80_07345 [Nitrososphaerales archaeon]|nr:hypothetical protein [Nitrososphaerales archaeon]